VSKPENEARGSLVLDAELNALNKITKALNALDGPTRRRVLAYLADRYAAKPEGGSHAGV
jgi:hypothetical protein